MRDDEVVAPLDFRLVPAALSVWVACLVALWSGPGAAYLVAGIAAPGAVLVLRIRRRWTRGAAVVLVCLAAGSLMCALRMDRISASETYLAGQGGAYADVVVDVDTDPQPLAARVGTGVRYLLRGTTVQAMVHGTIVTDAVPITLFCDGPEFGDVIPGQRISARGRLGVDIFQSWPTVSLSCTAGLATIADEPWWQSAGTALRHRFVAVADTLDGEAAGLLPGIVLGDRSGISPALTQDAKITGLTHLLAVSGSHFVVLCGAVLVVLRRAGPRVGAGGGLMFAVGLVVVVRPSPSVLRAAVMGGLTLAALLLGRNRSMVPALAAAVLVLLLLDPALAVEAGFALSVQATAAIVLIAPRWSEALQRRGWPAGWADLLTVPAVAQLGTMPVIAAISGTVSVWALPANMLVAPAVPIALILGAISTALSVCWTDGATVLAELAAPAADWIAFCAHWIAGWPVAVVSWPSSTGGVLALAAISVAIPIGLRFRRLRAVAVAAIVGAAVVLIPTQVLTPGWPPPGWVAVGCEVGQGDGFVVSTGRAGEAVVIDTGPEASVMDRCLTRLGITSVALLVLTHLHADHIDGLQGVLHGRTVMQIGVGPGREPAGTFTHVLDAARTAGIPVISLALGLQMNLGQLSLTVLGPDPGRVSAVLGPNDQSAVVLVEDAGFRMLFSGDIEDAGQQALLDSGQPLAADVLKIPHHGSAKLLPQFMAAVHPTVVMIGVGAGNDFGHPTEFALQLSRSVGVQIILRTDIDGDIGVTITDGVLGTATRGAAPIQPRQVPAPGDRPPTSRRNPVPRRPPKGQRLRRRGRRRGPPWPRRVLGPAGLPVPGPAGDVR